MDSKKLDKNSEKLVKIESSETKRNDRIDNVNSQKLDTKNITKIETKPNNQFNQQLQESKIESTLRPKQTPNVVMKSNV